MALNQLCSETNSFIVNSWNKGTSLNPIESIKHAIHRQESKTFSKGSSIAGRLVCLIMIPVHASGILVKPLVYGGVSLGCALASPVLLTAEVALKLLKACGLTQAQLPKKLSSKKVFVASLNAAACAILSPVGQIAQIGKAVAGVVYPKAYLKETSPETPSDAPDSPEPASDEPKPEPDESKPNPVPPEPEPVPPGPQPVPPEPEPVPPGLAPLPQLHLKGGFPNASSNCWLSATLQVINAVPGMIVQDANALQRKIYNENPETVEEFEQRKRLAAAILEVLRKSKDRETISRDEMQAIRTALNTVRYPDPRIFENNGADETCLKEILYILDYDPVSPEEDTFNGYGRFWLNAVAQMPYQDDEELVPQHPLSMLTDAPIQHVDGVPVLPFLFLGANEYAPEMISIDTLNPTFNPAGIDNEQEFNCIVQCVDGTLCNYELVGAIICSNNHFYSYVLEKDEHQSAWVKYDDRHVQIDEAGFRRDLSKATNFIYRKCV